MALQAPAPIGGFSQQHPCAGGQSRICGGSGDEVRQLSDHGELLVPVQRAGVGQHLDPHVADTTQVSRGAGQEAALTQAAFSIDWDARQVTCPQGATSISWSDQRKPSGTPVARVHFALADCDPCPLRPQCTKAAHRRWGRSLTLLSREQHELLARQRAEQQTTEWKARYNIRAGVEGTISQAVRATRLRRTPYDGQDKTHLASVLSATAVNLIRADAWLNGTPLGTTRVSHLARLNLAA